MHGVAHLYHGMDSGRWRLHDRHLQLRLHLPLLVQQRGICTGGGVFRSRVEKGRCRVLGKFALGGPIRLFCRGVWSDQLYLINLARRTPPPHRAPSIDVGNRRSPPTRYPGPHARRMAGPGMPRPILSRRPGRSRCQRHRRREGRGRRPGLYVRRVSRERLVSPGRLRARIRRRVEAGLDAAGIVRRHPRAHREPLELAARPGGVPRRVRGRREIRGGGPRVQERDGLQVQRPSHESVLLATRFRTPLDRARRCVQDRVVDRRTLLGIHRAFDCESDGRH